MTEDNEEKKKRIKALAKLLYLRGEYLKGIAKAQSDGLPMNEILGKGNLESTGKMLFQEGFEELEREEIKEVFMSLYDISDKSSVEELDTEETLGLAEKHKELSEFILKVFDFDENEG